MENLLWKRRAEQLKNEGLALFPASELALSEAQSAALAWSVQCFRNGERVQQARSDYARGRPRRALKQSLVKFQDEQAFELDHPLYLLSRHSRLVELVNGGLSWDEAECISIDLLLALPGAATRPREWSHNWHRDPESQSLIKVFWYFTAVDDESGPMEYVRRSHFGAVERRYLDLCPPLKYACADADARINLEHRARFCVPAGTIVAANTSGLHRGGYTKSGERLSACWTYTPINAKATRKFKILEPREHDHERNCLAV